MKTTLADWRFVAFVSALLLCSGLPTSADAAAHRFRRAPVGTGEGRLHLLFGSDIAGDNRTSDHLSALDARDTHQLLPTILDLASPSSSGDHDDDSVTAVAAPLNDDRVDVMSFGAVTRASDEACIVRAIPARLVRGPPRANGTVPQEHRVISDRGASFRDASVEDDDTDDDDDGPAAGQTFFVARAIGRHARCFCAIDRARTFPSDIHSLRAPPQ